MSTSLAVHLEKANPKFHRVDRAPGIKYFSKASARDRMEHNLFVALSLLLCTSHSVLAVDPQEGYSREQLQPLTKFRQQHQRTIDGRLCAAAFVQNRKAYTACTDAPNPSGVSGRPWCYVEPQVGAASWYLVNEHYGSHARLSVAW